MGDTVMIVGGRTDTVRKAVDLGLRVVLLQHKELLKPGQAELADAAILVDYLDWPTARPLVEAAHQAYGFTRVVSLAEQSMETVGRINDLLGLGGTSYDVSRRFRDKWLMREHLAGRFRGSVPAAQVDSPDAVRAFGAEHGYPLVVKPVDGTGSRGVVRVDGPGDVDAAWQQLAGLRGRDDLSLGWLFPVDRFIAEAYVEGPEYSVETFSFGGRHLVVAITEKLTAGFVEVGHLQPARVSAADEAAIVECTTEFLDAMGLRDGVAHTELRLSPDGPRIIESHDRVAGDRIMDLTENAYGLDLELYAVGWPFGLLPEPPERPRPLRGAATRFLYAEPGRVIDVRGVTEVRNDPAVVGLDVAVTVGAEVLAMVDNFDRIGQLVTVGADATAAIETCDRLAAQVCVVTAPAEQIPLQEAVR